MTRWSLNDYAAYLERQPGVKSLPAPPKDRPFGAPLTASIVIELSGPPVGKGRPRFAPKTGHAYTPAKTRKYEDELRTAGQAVMLTRKPWACPMRVSFLSAFPVPKSWPLRKREAALSGLIRPTVKPDADNILKCIGDALNGVVWVDDSQIVRLGNCEKRYDERPRLRIEIEPLLGDAT